MHHLAQWRFPYLGILIRADHHLLSQRSFGTLRQLSYLSFPSANSFILGLMHVCYFVYPSCLK